MTVCRNQRTTQQRLTKRSLEPLFRLYFGCGAYGWGRYWALYLGVVVFFFLFFGGLILASSHEGSHYVGSMLAPLICVNTHT